MRELRLLGLAGAAGLSLIATVYLLTHAVSGSGNAPAAQADDASTRRAVIEAKIADTPDVAPYFERLHALLPVRYEAAINKAATEPDASPDLWLSDAVKIVRQSHGALAAKADGAALSQVFTQQTAMLKALAVTDDRLCVDFLYGGASEGFFQFATGHRSLVSALALAGLDAVADGQTKKIVREAPSDADFQALEAALRERNLSATEITALLDGKSPEPPLPDARLCEMGQLYLDAIATLPEDVRLRLYALAVDLMARS